jgi:hypothetical protein
MDKATKLMEDMIVSQPQLLATYCRLTLNPPVVDGMINPIPSLVSLVYRVVNLGTSLVEPIDKVFDPIPSSVNPIVPLESETQEIDPFPSMEPILPLENETQVVDLIPSSINPTLPLESKPNIAHVFLVDTQSTMIGGIPPSLVEPPLSNDSILFDWVALTRPHLRSDIPFNIIVQVYVRDVPQMLIDEGASVSILSFIS